ncbi:MAG: translation initiation factor IF-3 [Akkermansiaceae bacterium]|nr:translation initiation factor IF-3 [Akkermansiaceae bacterium]
MTRVNERIRAPKIRVVTADGRQLGVMSSKEALSKAKSIGMDLVEIADKANPPVCKIIDYGKYKYEQAKLKKKTPKHSTKMKEIKFRVRTGEHDYNIKLSRAEEFLDEGHKVRFILQFRGRENAHRELGFEVLEKIVEDLKTMAQVDQKPRLSGRAVAMILSPLPKDKRKRHFHLYHGELIDEDEFEELEDDDDEDDDDDVEVETDHAASAKDADKD